LDLTVREEGNVTVVAIDGTVDGTTSDGLLAQLRELVSADRKRLVADFAGVTYTSSAGLRVLLATVKETRARGGDFRLAALRPDVKRVLDLAGFTSILKVYPDVPAAVASFA